MTDARYTTSTAFLEALREAGIRYAFANLGSDHTGFIEAYSQAERLGTLEDRLDRLGPAVRDALARRSTDER